MDRQDIDALLIGALYGELTPADEARLAAHLESHPTDRGALDDLKSARAAVRESRIFELQVEPPQAVSALLLQEAHRRAPKRAASDAHDGKDSWFFRFTRMFMAHPAMAAAAMLALVVGVFGVVQMRKGDQFAEQTYAPSSATETASNEAPAAAATPPTGGSAALAPDPAANHYADTAAGDVTARQGYEVQLDEATRARRADAKDTAGAPSREEQGKPERAQDSAKKLKGMVVTTPSPQPKELDAPRKAQAAKPPSVAKSDDAVADSDVLEFGAASPRTPTGAAAGTRGAPGADGAGPRAGAAGGGAASTEGVAGTAQRAPQNAPAQSAPSAPPPPPTAVTTARPTDAEAEKAAAPAKDNTLVAWAKGEHSRTVALANKGDCIAAAKAAVAVQNRAPDYYTQFMATDRALKKCQAYIALERDAEAERSGRSRAQKRVTTDAPAATSK